MCLARAANMRRRDAADLNKPCENVWKKLVDEELGHEYITFPGACILLVGCQACASFVQTGPQHTNLRRQCPRHPASIQAADRWAKMCKIGRHFKTKAVIGEPMPWSRALQQAEEQSHFWEAAEEEAGDDTLPPQLGSKAPGGGVAPSGQALTGKFGLAEPGMRLEEQRRVTGQEAGVERAQQEKSG